MQLHDQMLILPTTCTSNLFYKYPSIITNDYLPLQKVTLSQQYIASLHMYVNTYLAFQRQQRMLITRRTNMPTLVS